MSDIHYKKKLIEVALPLEEINEASRREKSIRRGHPSTLHLWWARRPLAACRAVLFAQLVDDPSSHPDKFPKVEDQNNERERLFVIIRNLVKWENTGVETVLEAARTEIRKSCGGNLGASLPKVYDPFSGGCSIPLEAQRLGLEAYGSDLNPVAVMIGKAMIEFPPKFRGLGAVNPEVRGGKTAARVGMAEDVRYYGAWMRRQAEQRIGHHYPKIEVTEAMAEGRDDLKPYIKKELTVIAYLWARTVPSPDPSAKGVPVPLMRTFELSVKSQTWVEPIIDYKNNSYKFEIRIGEGEIHKGTIRQGKGVCLLSDSVMDGKYIKSEAKAGRMGSRLIAVVAEGINRRLYLSPTDCMEEDIKKIQTKERMDFELCGEAAAQLNLYGMTHYQDIFTPRQLNTLTIFSDLVKESHQLILADALAAKWAKGKPLAAGGVGALAYADAIAIYLAFAVDKLADYGSSTCSWQVTANKIRSTFPRQAIRMAWDYAEVNSFSNSSGCWTGAIKLVSEAIETLPSIGQGIVEKCDARAAPFDGLILCTDPPYYDNINYADISDFFYIWLKRSIGDLFPKIFSTVLTPKKDELIASRFRHKTKEEANAFFLNGMKDVMFKISKRTTTKFPVALFYAFKQKNIIGKEGRASSGWETFLQAVLDSGFMVESTWPMRTELENRMLGIGTNALASSIVLVCRKRVSQASLPYGKFKEQLTQELEFSLQAMQAANLQAVDLEQALIGPGMKVFSQYKEILRANDTPLSLRDALFLINSSKEKIFSGQDSGYDAFTRFAIIWYEQNSFAKKSFGEAESLATARNITTDDLEDCGIAESGKGKFRLLMPNELKISEGWAPRQEKNLCHWKTLQAMRHFDKTQGDKGLTDIFVCDDDNFHKVKTLAYRLHALCEKRGESNDALSYNDIIRKWEHIQARARQQLGSKQSEL